MSLRAVRVVAAGAVVLAAAIVSSFAFDWPADSGRYRFSFGSPRDGFKRGLEFGSSGGIVRAADDGELTFAASGRSLPGGYPLIGGSMVVVSHASQISTIYAGLEPGSVSSYLRNVRKGDIIGRIEPVGGLGRGAAFYAYDAKERRYINPLILMPSLSDDKPPVIRSAILVSDGKETALAASKVVKQGSYLLLVDAFDPSPTGEQAAPYEVRVMLDGSERDRVLYDAAWAEGGRSTLFSGARLGEHEYLASDGRMRFGPYVLARGRVVISVVVGDFAGNKREQTYSIIVQ
ncbi:MAG TPA: M23 family metallopeptidase [Spirochaetales bacterium]|nr:M23 family metallopeptidase [Spirochaetales bacterium]HPM73024.1 M23 family metallopeptidase [Spirochaetales bacterium]